MASGSQGAAIGAKKAERAKAGIKSKAKSQRSGEKPKSKTKP